MQGDQRAPGDVSPQIYSNNANEQTTKNKQLMSATFYDGVKIKPNNNSDAAWGAHKQGVPVYEYKDGKKFAFAPQGFGALWSDLKPGLTLDKIFGGNFKKVGLDPHTVKGFEKPDSFSTNSTAPRSDEVSDPRNKHKEDDAELENANDLDNSRNDIAVGRVTRTRIDEFNYQGRDQGEINEKIDPKNTTQKRFNTHKVQQSPLRAHNKYINSQVAADKHEQENINQEQSRVEYIRGQPFENHRNQPRTHALGTEPRSLSVNANPKAKDKDRIREVNRGNAEQFQGSRQNFYKNAQENQFRVSSTGFRKSFYQQQGRDDGSGYQKKINAYNYEPPYSNNDRRMKTGMRHHENYPYGDDGERSRPESRNQQIYVQEGSRLRNTGIRFYAEKGETQNFSYKGHTEMNYIAERMERHEQELLNKYSSRQLLNNDEGNQKTSFIINSFFTFPNLGAGGTGAKRHNVSEMVGKRRLSTPTRDFYTDSSPFAAKNFTGKVEKSIF